MLCGECIVAFAQKMVYRKRLPVDPEELGAEISAAECVIFKIFIGITMACLQNYHDPVRISSEIPWLVSRITMIC